MQNSPLRKSPRPKIDFTILVGKLRSPAVASPETMTMTANTSRNAPSDTSPPNSQTNPSLASPKNDGSNNGKAQEIGQELRLILKVTGANDAIVNIAALHRRSFELMLHSDPSLQLLTLIKETPTIQDIAEFPTDDEYLSAFKIIKKNHNKISIAFSIRTQKTLPIIKRNANLLEHLKKNNMSLQTSLTGSDNKISIGAILGINPEKTSRDNLQADLVNMLHRIDQSKIDPDIVNDSQEKQPFHDTMPPFQLETRKIQKQHGNILFNTKAFHVICDAAHSNLMTTIFQLGMETDLFMGIGKFIEFKTDNASVCKAIKWHNDTITGTTAFHITDFPETLMDCTINATSTTTWRQKLISGGKLINIYKARESNRFIATTRDPDQSIHDFNSTFCPLFHSVFGDTILPPSAARIVKPHIHTEKPKYHKPQLT